jgi:hypothetical protein
MIVVGVIMILTAYDNKFITEEMLPTKTQTYIKQNYPDCKILIAKKDYEVFNTTYEVKLDNGLELNFDNNGILTNIIY